MTGYKSTENHKTELQWLANGFVLNENATGTEEWNNRYYTFVVTRYSFSEVHKDEHFISFLPIYNRHNCFVGILVLLKV